jgi:hypothetical protein
MKDIVKRFGELVTLVAKDGTATQGIEMVFQGEEGSFLTFDLAPEYNEGDEIRRQLPGGREQVFLIQSVQFRKGALGAIPDFYTLRVLKKGQVPVGTGGNYNITVSGDGAHINLHSTDNSTTSVHKSAPVTIFAELLAKVESEVHDVVAAERITTAIHNMESASNRKSLLTGYNEFLAAAANHMTLFLPLMPALTALIH